HFAEFHVFACATRLIEKVHESARKTAHENDHKAKGPNENGLFLRNPAEPVEHDLHNFFTEADSGVADRQSRDRSFDRHDGEKVNQWHPDAQRVGGKQESCKGCKMRHDRRTERNERCVPMMRIQMIGRENLNQLIAPRKMRGKKTEQLESTND